jgi:DNA-binding SARP family transcriptional activator
MDFRLFGPFEVWHEGARFDPGDLQQRYVLVNLLLNANHAVTREYIYDQVWRSQTPKSDILTSYIARLRKVFSGTEVRIEKTPTGYLLRVDPDTVDVNRFRRLIAEARAAGTPKEKARLLTEALDMWQGRYLADLDLDRVGGPAAAPADDLRVDALVDLAELELAAGQHRRIRDRIRPVWEEDRTQQRLAAPLMRALVAAGDQVQAVAVYHATRDALDEFGMDASRELRAAMKRAQYGEQLNFLPMRPPRFTGRADELALVDSVAATAVEDGPSVLWVSGMPGVGKTALAVQAAHRLGEVFPDGRLFVDLTGFTQNVEPLSAADALEQLLTDLGVPPESLPSTTTARAALYRRETAEKRVLVVLDNAASEDQIKPLLGATMTIVTSREQGELTASDHLRLEPLPPDEAVDLFRKLTAVERVHGRGDQVREVIARCGYVPLLVHLVAAQFSRHPRWPLEHLVDLLREASPVSPDTSFPTAANVACSLSYQQLTEAQQTLFRLFALAPGPDLSPAGAAALLGLPRARGLLQDLHRVSLLEESAPERYHMLDPLRDFVVSAHPVPDPVTPVDRLLDFYLAATAAAMAVAFPYEADRQPAVTVTAQPPRFPDHAAALAWLDEERRNLVAAVGYAADHDRPDHTWQLAVLLWRYFYTTGHLRDWTETMQRASAVLRGTDNTFGRAHVQLRLAHARWRSGALTEARTLAEEALPLWTTLRDLRGEADTLTAIATLAKNLGDLPAAAKHFAVAQEYYGRLGDARGQGNTLDLLGVVSEWRGELALAEEQHLAALELLRGISHQQGIAHVLDNLGCTRQRLGRLEEALANHAEARDLAVELGDRALEAYALNNLGNTHRLAGRLEEAVRCQQEARRVADLVVDPNLRTQLYLDRGETAWARDDDRGALHAYRAALDMSAGTGERAQWARANHRIAEVLHAVGQHHPNHWQDAIVGYDDLGLSEAGELRTALAGMSCYCTRREEQ